MVARIASHGPILPYGAAELRRLARPYMARATVTGSALWITLFLTLAATSGLWRIPALPEIVLPDYRDPVDVLPLPSIIDPSPQTPWKPATPSSSKAGEIVPVPEQAVIYDVPFAPTVEGTGTGEQDVLPHSTGQGSVVFPGDRPDPFEIVHADQLPEAVVMPKPEYPELAKQNQVEGLVVVRALVGKDGRVKEVFVHRETSVLLLDGAAMEAARRWVFTPALADRHPVAVWVSIPFRFTLDR